MSEQTGGPINHIHVGPPIDRPTPMGGNLTSLLVMMVSQQDQQWIDDVRTRSYHLSIERGHLRYN